MHDTEPKVLIVCASRHGHTRRIAERLAGAMTAEGMRARLVGVDEARALRLLDHDAVVVAGSVHTGCHDRRLVAWARDHHAELAMRPTGFLSVSMSAATAEGRATARDYLDRFVEDTDWTPTRCLTVAGALQYREYDFLTRQMVRQVARKKGLSTDVRHDTEYTDWAEVDRFARTLAAAARPLQPA